MPNLMAFDICGVQPMSGPAGQIFALKSHYSSQGGTEALFNEADTGFASSDSPAQGETDGPVTYVGDNTGYTNTTTTTDAAGDGYTIAEGENLGDGGTMQEMAFSIEKVTVTATTRALKAEYTVELAQDLKAVHGLDAEEELANILSNEILAEINREVVRKINVGAKLGCQTDTTTTGIFDLDTDSNGRWMVEKFKGLLFRIELEANEIARQTRRGKGNILICSSDVASALAMAGILDSNKAIANLEVDDTGSTFAGTIGGRTKVYIDPYHTTSNGYQYATVGYRGPNPIDAAFFYCPYIPLEMVRAVGENTFQPKIAFRTRYGIATNPFVTSSPDVVRRVNQYYRIFRIDNLM